MCVHTITRYVDLCLLVAAMGLLLGCRPPNGDADVERGYALRKNGDYAGAVETLEKAIASGVRRYPQDEVYCELASAYAELGRFDDSERRLRKAMEFNALNYKVWSTLGVIHRHRSEFDQAEQCYTMALSIKPTAVEAHINLSTLYLLQNKIDQAMASVDRAIELDPGMAGAHANRAAALAMQKRFNEADDALNKAVSLGYANGPEMKKKFDAMRSSK